MTVQPDDPNFGNKGIENMGSDLLARLSQPNKPEADYTEEADAFFGQFDGNEGSEPENFESFDPEDPGVSEQRRLLALQMVIAAVPSATTDDLIRNAQVVEKWLKAGGDESAPEAPEAADGPQASPGADPGEGLTGPEGV